MDCEANQSLCRAYKVNAYPTLKVFRGVDDAVAYNGKQTADRYKSNHLHSRRCSHFSSIVETMLKELQPSVAVAKSEVIADLRDATTPYLLAFFDSDDARSHESYITAANSLRHDYQLLSSSDPALAAQEGATVPSILLHMFGKRSYFDGPFDTQAIKEFARNAWIPHVGELTPVTHPHYLKVSRTGTSQPLCSRETARPSSLLPIFLWMLPVTAIDSQQSSSPRQRSFLGS